jgi:hypothetical protein
MAFLFKLSLVEIVEIVYEFILLQGSTYEKRAWYLYDLLQMIQANVLK